jgi:uncharacterized membrane-anchored protein
MRRSAIVLVSLLAPASLAGQGQSAFDAIPWHRGPTTGDLGAEAQVTVPGSCLFTGRDGVRQFLELTQNPWSDAERGVLFCQPGAQDLDPWFVVFTFDPSGYVKDDERDELNAGKLLKSMQRGTAEGNKERARRGWPTLTLDGWMTSPYYDERTNNLTWATAITDSYGEKVVNHSVRLLGRGGVMHVDLVAGPGQLDDIMLDFEDVVAGFEFKQGHRYAEWRAGDRVAAYGLTGLIVGGAGLAAVKSGLLAKLWKLLAAAAVAVDAAFKSVVGLFTRKQPATPAARTPVTPPARPGGAPASRTGPVAGGPGITPTRPGMPPARPGVTSARSGVPPTPPGPAAGRR